IVRDGTTFEGTPTTKFSRDTLAERVRSSLRQRVEAKLVDSLPALHRHTDFLKQSLALLLEQICQVGQRLALRQGVGQASKKARKCVEDREEIETDCLQSRVPASLLRFLPKRLALASQCQVIVRPQQDQVVDDGRFHVQRGEFGRQILGLGGTAAEEKADSHFPRLP